MVETPNLKPTPVPKVKETVSKPKRLLCGPFKFDYVYADLTGHLGEDTRAIGYASLEKQKIFIDSNSGPDVQRETTFHETWHALMYTTHLCEKLSNIDPDLEEEIIRTLSPLLLTVMRQNPKLMEYLLK